MRGILDLSVPIRLMQRKTSASKKANGHAGPNGRINGHGAALTGGSAPHSAAANGRAASDDASGAPGAETATSSAGRTGRKACAEVARPLPGELAYRPEPGDECVAEMQDGSAFVNAVASRINLVRVAVRLLSSEDEKIAQRMLERSLDMKFGKASAAVIVEEAPRPDFGDLPVPMRD